MHTLPPQVCPQHDVLYLALTVYQNIEFFLSLSLSLSLRGVAAAAQRDAMVLGMIAKVGLWDGNYSWGACIRAPKYPTILRCVLP